jgi:hypothetical protein
VLCPNSSVCKDMPKLDSSVGQHLPDEQPPVAVLRISLAADEANPMALRPVDEPLDRRLEGLLFGHRPIESMAVGVVVLIARRPATQLLSEEQIADAMPGERRLELVAVEVWRETRVRVRPHVHEKLDPLA